MHGIDQHPNAWRMLQNRQPQNWKGLRHIKGMIPVLLPPLLNSIISQLEDIIFQAHVLNRPKPVFTNQFELAEDIHAMSMVQLLDLL